MFLYYVKVVMIKVGRSVSWSDPISGLGNTTSRLRDMKFFFLALLVRSPGRLFIEEGGFE